MEVARYLEERRRLIDKWIKAFLERSYNGSALDISKYIAEGGKRLRGILAVAFCEALGGKAEDARNAAIALELVHASSLALDDIIDEDVERRGRPSAWVSKGIKNTILVTNLLIPRSILLVKVYGIVAMKMALKVWEEMTLGEMLDTRGGDYEKIIELKTASLFALASFLGSLAAGREDLKEKAWRYGFLVGKAYQIADDMVDSERGEPGSAELFKAWSKRKNPLEVISRLVKEAEEIGKELSPLLEKLPFELVRPMLALKLGR